MSKKSTKGTLKKNNIPSIQQNISVPVQITVEFVAAVYLFHTWAEPVYQLRDGQDVGCWW